MKVENMHGAKVKTGFVFGSALRYWPVCGCQHGIFTFIHCRHDMALPQNEASFST
jgi:hypothetical protein